MQLENIFSILGEATPIIIILIIVILFLSGLVLKTFLGWSFKFTIGTFARGRTATEKIVYFFSTIGMIVFAIVVVLVASVIGLTSIDFVIANIYYVGIVLFILVFIVLNCLFCVHKKKTPLAKDMDWNPFEKKRKRRFRK